jgi:hypothetical protein
MRLFNSLLIVTGFVLTIAVACSKDGADAAAASTGTGGSLARFTIAASHLYLADYSRLEVYDITNPANPVKKTPVDIGWGVETIYPYGDKLFIGSVEGMYIYSIADPARPVKLGEARHVRSCDPVVAKDNIAYVTLQGSGRCGAATDGLYIYDITNLTTPVQKSLLEMSTPYGLGIKDSVAFICRKANGMTLVNVKNPSSPKVMYTRNDATEYRDVIPVDNILLCYVSTGLLIYDVSNLNNIIQVGSYTFK